MPQRVFLTYAPTNAASCKGCGRGFSKGDTKVMLCSPSMWHSGLDELAHCLRCAMSPMKRHVDQGKDIELYSKFTHAEMVRIEAAHPGLIPHPNTPDLEKVQEESREFEKLQRLILSEIGPKVLKEILKINKVYHEDDWKGPALSHSVASGIFAGKVDEKCKACGETTAWIWCPAFGEFFCGGTIEGFAHCSNHLPPSELTPAPIWMVPKSAAKPKSAVMAFQHPYPQMAPELVVEGTEPSAVAAKAPAKGKAKKASAAAATAGDKRTHAAVDISDPDGDNDGDGEVPMSLDLGGREFSGMSFCMAGRFKGGRPQHIRSITSRGGNVVSAVSKATHILVPSGIDTVDPAIAKIMKGNKKIPVVSSNFLEKFELGWRSATELAKSGQLLFDSPPGKDIVAEVETVQSLAKKAGLTATIGGDAEEAPAAPAKRRKISKQQTTIDPECGSRGTIVTSPDGERVYSITLNCIEPGISKYYIMQLIQVSKSRFVVFKKWGSTGGGYSLDVNEKSFNGLKPAVAFFEKHFKDKSGNDFSNVHNFKKKMGKYHFVDQYEEEEDEDEKQAGVAPMEEDIKGPSQLPEQVQEFVRKIFDAKEVQRTMEAIGINSQKLPLGKLSKKVIREAYSTLTELALLLSPAAGASSGTGKKKKTEVELSATDKIRIKALSTKFHTQIPCSAHRIRPIDNLETLKEKILLLDELMNVEAGLDVMAVAGAGEVDVDRCYNRLGIQLEPIAKSAKAFKTIVDYVKLTHSSQHSSYELKVLTAFDVSDEKQSSEFGKHSKKIGNKQLLWHGSRLSNWTGILSQGLRIAPPEAPVTGYMFGKGVYFANSVSKSANYCHPDFSSKSPRGILLLCEVALGTPKPFLHAQSSLLKAPPGSHSVQGVGRVTPDQTTWTNLGKVAVPTGKLTERPPNDPIIPDAKYFPLYHDEHIIYDTRQQVPRYLIEVEFKRR